MARVRDTVVEGTTKFLMWKESAAIVAVRHLCTEVSRTGKLSFDYILVEVFPLQFGGEAEF